MREVPLNAPGPASSRRLRFWVITLAALLALAVTVSLGRWQLSRAAQKESLQARIEAQTAHPPLDMAAFLSIEQAATELHRRVTLRGLWLPAQTVFLDNRQMNGKPGFFVMTPLALEGTAQTILVQRGWVPRNFVDRTQLPQVDTPAGLVDVTGQIEPPPAKLLELGAGDAQPAEPGGAGSSPIRQNLDLSAFRAETGLPLRTELSLMQIGSPSEGLEREWPAPALGIEKHYGYAFQWFGLATLVTLLYAWFQFIAPRRRRG